MDEQKAAELIRQLKRIADALERLAPKPEGEQDEPATGWMMSF